MKKTVMTYSGVPGFSGFYVVIFTIEGNADTDEELLGLAKKAAKMYKETEDGKREYERNNGSFSWSDLVFAVGSAGFAKVCRELGGLTITYIASSDEECLVVCDNAQLMDDDE